MAGKTETIEVDGRKIALSNLDKVLYPAAQFTKAQVIDYYVRVSRFILPHLKDRPITLVRFPDGVRGEHFYEKNAPSHAPKWIKRFAVPHHHKAGHIDYILINDLPTLIWAANMASLELHPFLHRAPKIDAPTEIVFDLDPGEGADVLTCARVAALVRSTLAHMKLESLAKVSGSKGLQLYAPLNAGFTYEAVKPFAKAFAEAMELRHPELIVSKMSKNLRTRKVFIDWSQNTQSKTTVSVYSLRAKADTPYVSLPVTWDELAAAERANDPRRLYFEPAAALARLDKIGDLFAPVEKMKQKLPREISFPASVDTPKPLEKYGEKRNFSVTREPLPAVPERGAGAKEHRFVVQKHAASHLHYDFRLEMHGVLKSWAVPKGPPLTTNEKRLAMPTEDHPLAYLNFEGIIPKGQYGGGTVMVWDIGTYEAIDGNVFKGHLKFRLDGKKLKGEWVLTRSRRDGDRPKWLWLKSDAKPLKIAKAKIDRSALSGHTMEQIAKNPQREWHSNRSDGNPRSALIAPAAPGPSATKTLERHQRKAALDLASLPTADVKFVEPMLAKVTEKLPEGPNWQYEIKLDGYRALVVKREKKIDLFSRRGNQMAQKYRTVADAFDSLPANTVLDGEIVALDDDGRPNFNALQNWKPTKPVFFYAFDILAYKGHNLMALHLSNRRKILEEAMRNLDDPVRLSPIFDFPAEDVIRAAREQRLEGIVAKRIDSCYEPGQRTGVWLKFKTRLGQELVIGGYTPGRYVFDALIVGYYAGARFVFVAKVRNGFTPALRIQVGKRFEGLEMEKCPFANLPEPKTARRGLALDKEAMKECLWLKPKLVARIEFAEWTDTDHLRNATFVALREDEDPRQVRKEIVTGDS